MKNYLEGVKKRIQLILLIANVLLASGNLFILSTKLESLEDKMLLYCRTVNFTDTICQEQ